MQLLYPPGPHTVPEGLTRASSAHQRHAWLAVVGLVAFVALHLGLTIWFAYKGFALLRDAWGSGSVLGFAAGIVASFFAIFLGKALFFIKHGRDDSLIEITPENEPQLFAFVNRLADEARAPRPHRVYLSPRVNAAVFYDLSFLNLLFPSRKNLEIGLGLVNVLDLGELKAVLAHEFGHFAQRSMAVGRWVYVGQQIAARIVGKRDVLDRFLLGISHTDIRIAWIGWSMRIVVWSIRSITDSFFRVVILAERALSREMELQADRVAVSLTGSDALIHALYKLPTADDAWDHAASVAATQLESGKRVTDLFSLQSRALEQLGRIMGDDARNRIPPVPEHARAEHRLFAADLAQPPQMWSTHPPNHVREENAKRQYVEAPVDDRPAWVLFSDPSALRARMTDHMLDLGGQKEDAERLTVEASLAALDVRFDRTFLDPRYHGLYMGRPLTRCCDRTQGLYGPVPTDPQQIQADLRDDYPPSVGDSVTRLRQTERERAQLEALADGLMDAPGGLIHYRGRPIRRRELRGVVEEARRECEALRHELLERDRQIRVSHWAAAAALQRGWPQYLEALLMLLHFAEHSEANVDDAMGHLQNVTEVVTADGRVSEAEARRLVSSGADLQQAMAWVWETRNQVIVTPDIARKLEAQTWAEALGEAYVLPPPNEHDIGDFMGVVSSWHSLYSARLAELRFATLEALLEAEAHVSRCYLGGTDPGDAPPPPVTPAKYPILLQGHERERQKRLDWWDRFMVADGVVPSLARLAVAASVVGAVVGFGTAIGAPSAVVYNGFSREVIVSIDGFEVVVEPRSHATLEFEHRDRVRVEARANDGQVIESFEVDVDNGMAEYVYSVAGATPLVEWTASYGDAHEVPPRMLGALRWFQSDADIMFREPPQSVSTSGEGSTRTVLTAVEEPAPEFFFSALEDPAARQAVALAHARWDLLPGAVIWIPFVGDDTVALDVVRQRLAEAPREVALGRFEQDLTTGEEHAKVCDSHRSRAVAEPGELDYQYLALRCMQEGEEQDAAFLRLSEEHPRHPWLSLAASFVHFQHDDLASALSALRYAREMLGSTPGDLALVEARIRRLTAPELDAVDLQDLLGDSRELQLLVELETMDVFGDTTYARLSAGDLQGAVDAAAPGLRARALRLAAASDGADEALKRRALALAPEDGIDADTVWSALALARLHGQDITPYVELVRGSAGNRVDRLLLFADPDALRADLEAADQRLRRFVPELRGHAAVLGSVVLGSDAPPHWRTQAERLLFASERPFFAPVETEAEPEEPAEGTEVADGTPPRDPPPSKRPTAPSERRSP